MRPSRKLCSCCADLSYVGSAMQNICGASKLWGLSTHHVVDPEHTTEGWGGGGTYLESIVDSIQRHAAKIGQHPHNEFLRAQKAFVLLGYCSAIKWVNNDTGDQIERRKCIQSMVIILHGNFKDCSLFQVNFPRSLLNKGPPVAVVAHCPYPDVSPTSFEMWTAK